MAYPSFNSGDVLNASDMNAVSGWKVSTATVTGIGTGGVIVNNLFTTDYDRFRLHLYDVLLGAGTGAVFMQLTASGTQSATGYYSAGQYVLWATNTGANSNTNNGVSWVAASINDTIRASSCWDIMNVSNATQTQIVGQKQNWDALENMGGYHSGTSVYDGLRFYTNTGTASLKLAVYGYRD